MSQSKSPLICPKGCFYLQTESVSPNGRGEFYARVPHGHGVDDVVHPAYFGLNQSGAGDGPGKGHVRVGDLIDVEPETAIWRVQLRVMALRPEMQQVVTRIQQSWDFSVKLPAGFKLDWHGPTAKWKIFKGEIEIDKDFAGYDTQEEALERIKQLQREKTAA